MKTRKHHELIKILQKHQSPLNAAKLANQLGISSRTIRTYVAEINAMTGGTALILSSQQGYQLNPANDIRSVYDNKKNRSPIARRQSIIRKLLANKEQLNSYYFSDILYVSEATIEFDLQLIKQQIALFQLELKKEQHKLTIVGSEYNKRRLMSEMLYQELDQRFWQLPSLQIDQVSYNFQQLKSVIETILTKHNLFYNGYTINNILLHVIIAIERIKNQCDLTQSPHQIVSGSDEYRASEDIALILSQQFNLVLNQYEISYLALILLGKTSIAQRDNVKISHDKIVIEQSIANLTQRIINKVKREYHIDLTDETFFVRFSVHLQNMIARLNLQRPAKNPLAQKIKADYPLIYDAAVFISDLIQEQKQLRISEDEIAYIAFHIGSFFENQKNCEDKVTAVVVCPKYHLMHHDLVNKLSRRLGESLEILEVITSTDLHNLQRDYDIVVSTLPISTTLPIVMVDNFVKEKDIQHIYQMVDKIKKNKYKQRMAHYLQRYFSPELFSCQQNFRHSSHAIEFMCQKLITLGYVANHFTELVLQREQLSTTSFNNNIALPHAIGTCAHRSAIQIAINRHPMQWGLYKVQIIVLIAMSQSDRQQFRQLFDLFIEVLSEQDNVKQLANTRSYQQFMQTLLPLMENDNPAPPEQCR